jgi:deoxyadenosine/deoxycytidine kinase
MRIGLVGPCGAGKTTYSHLLRSEGYEVRHIAQEHSYVQDMWRKISKPDVLIFLDVSYPSTISRRQLAWRKEDYDIQQQRLRHARLNADLYIDTDQYSIEETTQLIRAFIIHYLQDNLSYE